MKRRIFLTLFSTLLGATACLANPWAQFEGKEGAAKGKHIVFVTGDDEYFSEQGMPILAKMLAERHGFSSTVLFAINKQTGVIDTDTKDNIPGLEALEHADLMVLFLRWRALPDDQMKHIADYMAAGHPIIGLRTATHPFNYPSGSSSAYLSWNWNATGANEGGFGRKFLGETWINHWGQHGGQSTRGLIAPGAKDSPLTRGLADGDIWVTTDVYQVRLPQPADCHPVIMGQVLSGMKPTDPPAPATEKVDKNNPMMPVAWTRELKADNGATQRVFTSTMGGAMSGSHDWDNEGFRRLFTNACYWCTGLEDKIPAKANVELAGDPGFKRGVKPEDITP